MSLVENLKKVALLGSVWVMYVLLGLSVLSMAAMVERLWFFRTRTADVNGLGDRLIKLLEGKERDKADALLAADASIEAAVLRKALRWVTGGAKSFADAVDSEFGKKKKELERGMTLLGTLGNNAPFIGLFGTVIGIIVAFDQLGDGQNKAAMDHVMSGISEALIATGVGLFVAIPAVVAYNVFQKKIADIEGNVAALTKQVCALLEAEAHPGYRGTSTNGRSSVPGHAESSRSLPRAAVADVAS